MLRWVYIGIAMTILFALGFNDYLITTDLLADFPPSVLYFTDYFRIPFGLNVLISAYTLRFVIRRVHLIS